MFDASFPEMMLLAIIALVVLGPERLPVVARTLGKILGNARRLFSKFQQDFMQETNKLEREVQESILAVKEVAHQTEEEIEKLMTEEYVDESEAE